MPKHGPEATYWKMEFYTNNRWVDCYTNHPWETWDNIRKYHVAPIGSAIRTRARYRYVSKTGIRFIFTGDVG